MGLLTRLVRLCKADFHGFLDAIESPETALRFAIREMEEELERDAARVSQYEKRIKVLNLSLERLAEREAECATQIDSSFEAGNHQLARSFLRRKLEIAQESKAQSDQVKELRLELSELEQKRIEREEKLSDIRERMESYAEERKHQAILERSSDRLFERHDRGVVRDEDVELAFIRELEKRSLAARG